MQHAPNSSRIVLIEDDENVRTGCAELLTARGYHVTTAATGVEGARLICDDLPDLVVTDITLPDLDGRDIVRLLRAHTPTRHIPVIAATAERSVPGPGDAGLFVGVLHKPFTGRKLLEMIEQHTPAAATGT
jgi:CheY-like chemotaxis protein